MPEYAKNLDLASRARQALDTVDAWVKEAAADNPDVGEDDIFVDLLEAYILLELPRGEDSALAKELRRRTGTNRRDNVTWNT